jgi:hypothetical protein
MGFTRIDTQDISGSAITPAKADLSTAWTFQGGLSGSLQRTGAGLSYLVAGSGISIVSASNGQVSIATTGAAGLTTSNFIWNEAVTGSNGVADAFTLAAAPTPVTSLRVFKNGLRMMSGSQYDYTLLGRTLTFNAGSVPTSGSNIVVDYMV